MTSAECAVNGSLVGLGVRLGTYATALAYFALILRLRKNQNLFTVARRLIQLGNFVALLGAVMLITIFVRGFRGLHAAEFMVFAHLMGIQAAIITHARMVAWAHAVGHTRSCFDMLKEMGMIVRELSMTAQWLAVYILMWCAALLLTCPQKCHAMVIARRRARATQV